MAVRSYEGVESKKLARPDTGGRGVVCFTKETTRIMLKPMAIGPGYLVVRVSVQNGLESLKNHVLSTNSTKSRKVQSLCKHQSDCSSPSWLYAHVRLVIEMVGEITIYSHSIIGCFPR